MSKPTPSIEDTFWDTIDQAQKEWDRQASLPDDEYQGMSPAFREGYLDGCLRGHLHSILAMAKLMPRPPQETAE